MRHVLCKLVTVSEAHLSPRMSSLKILFTSTSYPKSDTDWRSVFVRNLVFALARERSIQLRVWAPAGPLPQNVTYACREEESAWLDHLMEGGGIAHLLRKGGVSRFTTPLRLVQMLQAAYRREKADLFHANWLQSALPMYGTKTPAVISVLGADYGLLRWPGMTHLLRRSLRQRRCVIAPNAEWMQAPLQERFGDLARVQTVPFGVDQRWFAVQRADTAAQPRKWLVVSRLTRAKLGPLFESGAGIFGRDDELHLFGPMQESLPIPDWVHYHGPTHPAQLEQDWFPNATGLLTLSQHDEGRPQVMLEAMASGLPILASRLPAHTGLIDHARTGWLVGDRDELIAGLRWLSDPLQNRKAGSAARDRVRNEIGTWDDCAHRYVQIYHSLLEPG